MGIITVKTIPYFDDNYSFIIRCEDTETTALVDCGDSSPVLDYLDGKGWRLDYVFITHFHHDHAGDIQELMKYFDKMVVVKPAGENRLTIPALEVQEGDEVNFGKHKISVLSVPAHTKYCTCYFVQSSLFVGDALFSAGCGRLFEGQASDLERAMDKMLGFSDDVKVYAGHEYTLSNLAFASFIESENEDIKEHIENSMEKRSKGGFTIPSTIGLEKKINPFLRIDNEAVIKVLDPDQKLTRTERMGLLRRKKDSF